MRVPKNGKKPSLILVGLLVCGFLPWIAESSTTAVAQPYDVSSDDEESSRSGSLDSDLMSIGSLDPGAGSVDSLQGGETYFAAPKIPSSRGVPPQGILRAKRRASNWKSSLSSSLSNLDQKRVHFSKGGGPLMGQAVDELVHEGSTYYWRTRYADRDYIQRVRSLPRLMKMYSRIIHGGSLAHMVPQTAFVKDYLGATTQERLFFLDLGERDEKTQGIRAEESTVEQDCDAIRIMGHVRWRESQRKGMAEDLAIQETARAMGQTAFYLQKARKIRSAHMMAYLEKLNEVVAKYRELVKEGGNGPSSAQYGEHLSASQDLRVEKIFEELLVLALEADALTTRHPLAALQSAEDPMEIDGLSPKTGSTSTGFSSGSGRQEYLGEDPEDQREPGAMEDEVKLPFAF